jgi:hypothetical protein
MGTRNKIMGSSGTFYPTYLDPLVPLFCIFSLWRPATSIKMNGYLPKTWQVLRLNILSIRTSIDSIRFLFPEIWSIDRYKVVFIYGRVKSTNIFNWFSKLFYILFCFHSKIKRSSTRIEGHVWSLTKVDSNQI